MNRFGFNHLTLIFIAFISADIVIENPLQCSVLHVADFYVLVLE